MIFSVLFTNFPSDENSDFHAVIDPKCFRIRFDKIDGFIRIYDGTRHLTSFGPEKYAIYDRIRYHINLKSIIT